MPRPPGRAALAPAKAQLAAAMGRSDLEISLAFQMRAAGLPAWVEEWRFDPLRQWRVDFAWPELAVACEVEGGSWSHGAHVRGKHFESDCEKYCELAIAGVRLARVSGDMVEDGRALILVERLVGSAQARQDR